MKPNRDKKRTKQPKAERLGMRDEKLLAKAREFLMLLFVNRYFESWLETPAGQKDLQSAYEMYWRTRKDEEHLDRKIQEYG